MSVMQRDVIISSAKSNLLELCFRGWFIHVWGLYLAFGGLAPVPLVLAPAVADSIIHTADVKLDSFVASTSAV